MIAYVATFVPRSWFRLTLPVIRSKRLRKRLIGEVAVTVCAIALLLAIAPLGRVLLVLGGSWAGIAIALPLNNWKHHRGCANTTVDNSAWTVLRWSTGRAGFFIGYHAAHHLRPGAHWTELPSVHSTIFEAATKRPTCDDGQEAVRTGRMPAELNVD